MNVLCFDLPNVGMAKKTANCDFSATSFDRASTQGSSEYRHDHPPTTNPVGSSAPPAVTIHDVPPAAPGKPTVSYRLRVPALEKDIDANASTFKVKKNSVEVCLRKKNTYDHWTALASKKTSSERKEEKSKPDDPTASINDMMRSLYEDGDDATRKIIGESMLKSREEQARRAAGMPASKKKPAAAGAFGGLGMDDGMDDEF